MRVQKFSLLAVAVAAGLSLTACQSGDDSSAGSDDSSSSAQSSGAQSSGSQDSGGSSASTGEGTGTAGSDASAGGSTGAASGTGACQTSQLAFSSSGGMAEGTLIVNLKNTGSGTCTLKGFPGADLKGKDGTVSAERSKLAPPSVSVKAGEETRFTLHYPSNDSGGSGVTFTSLVVTPPDETHSHTLPVSINVPISDGSGPAITVDPVGTGK
ncbi:DUF4232 domain-containing protein [Streptomyces sp. AcE210]|uniref:DUF4232 domain-containing protein n=1 Tax=Streptomyces sp. AcE210 TaxID=2292703 RepID=UPI000E30B13F|nr:DUF4232 domain-containing protein [Streptomyces sp. AcE210]RFC69900.1 DUF4232 domain-containing protein [Streptomyces sp. AcE210]